MTTTSATALITELGARPDWQASAACRDRSDTAFFADDVESAARAKAVCAVCPVRRDCLAFALHHDLCHGVWGGLTARQRQPLRLRVTA